MNTVPKIPFGRPWITESEREAVLDVLAGDILAHGPNADAFGKEFEDYVGTDATAVPLSSGMAALHMAYLGLGIGVGDEVVVTAQTHVATVNAIELVGARPVFVDCEKSTGNISLSAAEAAITERTRAIALVHFVGIPCEMDAILRLAEHHELRVVEDCALAVGAKFNHQHVGLSGDAGCFSFYPAKHITTGEGGLLLTRHAELAAYVTRARAHGVDRDYSKRVTPGMYDVTGLGLNYRMSDISAAIGRQQLNKLPEIIRRRERNFLRLKSILSGEPRLTILDSQSEMCTNSHYCLVVVLGDDIVLDRNQVIIALNNSGIGTSIYYPHPLPRLQYYREKYSYNVSDFMNAANISDRSIALPVGPHIGLSEIEFIGETLTSYLAHSE